jgi:hypothetical protein
MEIVSLKELESQVLPLASNKLIEIIELGQYNHTFISRKFDYLKVISNPYSNWYDIEPVELRCSLANASYLMGDSFIYLSFVVSNECVPVETPLNFKFPTKELVRKNIDLLKLEAEKLIDIYFTNVLVYSPQGLWATLMEPDCYGTIGMTKQFLDLIRSTVGWALPRLLTLLVFRVNYFIQ